MVMSMIKSALLLIASVLSSLFLTSCAELSSGQPSSFGTSSSVPRGPFVEATYVTMEEGFLHVQLPGRDSRGREITKDILLPGDINISMKAFEQRFGPLVKGRRCRVYYQQRQVANDFGGYFSASVMTHFEWL
jgi:hypothetical protein